MEKEFTQKIIENAVLKNLDEYNTLEDLLNDVFKPWIIGEHEAAQALEDFDEEDQIVEKTNLAGVFGAIQYVKDYESLTYGAGLSITLFNELTDPERLASMVAYINGEAVIQGLADDLGINLDEELTDEKRNKARDLLN